jgi:hypothetical protein
MVCWLCLGASFLGMCVWVFHGPAVLGALGPVAGRWCSWAVLWGFLLGMAGTLILRAMARAPHQPIEPLFGGNR